jgi:hypothetical protein
MTATHPTNATDGANIPSDDDGHREGVPMPFILLKDRSRTAIDTVTGSRMFIKSGPQIEYKKAIFTHPDISLDFGIEIRRKFPDQPIVTDDPRNPCVMIRAGDLNAAFAARGMRDFEQNTLLAEYLARMIAFINKHHRLANAPFLWSDYEKLRPDMRLYRMPSDEELLKLSMQPESDRAGA